MPYVKGWNWPNDTALVDMSQCQLWETNPCDNTYLLTPYYLITRYQTVLAARWNLNKVESYVARFNTDKVLVITLIKVNHGFLPGIPDHAGSTVFGGNFYPAVICWVVKD